MSQVRNGHTTLANVLRKYPVAGMADDKSGQMETVINLIIKQGVFSFSMVSNEVEYYFYKLGILNSLCRARCSSPPVSRAHVCVLLAAASFNVIYMSMHNATWCTCRITGDTHSACSTCGQGLCCSLCHLLTGLDPYYFQKFNPAQISKHVHSFIAAKKVLLQPT